jgi:hypothetical protein
VEPDNLVLSRLGNETEFGQHVTKLSGIPQQQMIDPIKQTAAGLSDQPLLETDQDSALSAASSEQIQYQLLGSSVSFPVETLCLWHFSPRFVQLAVP